MTDKEQINRGRAFEMIYKLHKKLDEIEEDLNDDPYKFYRNAYIKSANFLDMAQQLDHNLENLSKLTTEE